MEFTPQYNQYDNPNQESLANSKQNLPGIYVYKHNMVPQYTQPLIQNNILPVPVFYSHCHYPWPIALCPPPHPSTFNIANFIIVPESDDDRDSTYNPSPDLEATWNESAQNVLKNQSNEIAKEEQRQQKKLLDSEIKYEKPTNGGCYPERAENVLNEAFQNYNNSNAKYENPPNIISVFNDDNTSTNATKSGSGSTQSTDNNQQGTNSNQQNGNQQNNVNSHNDQNTNNNNGDDGKDNNNNNNHNNKRNVSNKKQKKKKKNKNKKKVRIHKRRSIQKEISDKKRMIERVRKIKWNKVPVSTKKNNAVMLTLEITKMEIIDSLIQFINDKTNENHNRLIQVLMHMSNDSNKRWCEYVWIVKLTLNKLEHDINIGISLKYNYKNKNVQVTGIHLDKQSILKRHKLAVPLKQHKSHECHCLDGVNFGISNLIIHAQKIDMNHAQKIDMNHAQKIDMNHAQKIDMNPFKQFVQDLASMDCDINDEWKRKAKDLLKNYKYSDDESIIERNEDSVITNITNNSLTKQPFIQPTNPANSSNTTSPTITNINNISALSQSPMKSVTSMIPYHGNGNTTKQSLISTPFIPWPPVVMFPYNYYPFTLPIPPVAVIPTTINATIPPLNPYTYNKYYPLSNLPTPGHIQTSNQHPPQLQFPLLQSSASAQ